MVPEPHSLKVGWHFDNSYARMPAAFFTRTLPVPVRHARLAIFNKPLAQSMGLNAETLASDEAADLFVGNQPVPGAEPLAQAYAGHQFGHFTMLGDGRAILLGEHLTPQGERLDIQLKGAGRTAYSRRGDGRAALGPMLREYLISEAMHALGIPTTRSLAVATTGEDVVREEPLAGAILTRVAASHIRVGTFEYAARLDDPAALRALADHTLHRHYPDLTLRENPYLALLQAVIERQASLIAKWLHVGFIHGVMNTDNMALSGESIDYGPCAFLDRYDALTVFSSIDRQGRYAYGNQPQIAQWNLARLAESLLPLIDSDEKKALPLAQDALETFPSAFRRHWLAGMRAKLGLFTEKPEDETLIKTLLEAMTAHQADYTNTLRSLHADGVPAFTEPSLVAWHQQWRNRLAEQPQTPAEVTLLLQNTNPAFIPRNHQVEAALQAATENGDFQVLHRLLTTLSTPYKDQPGTEDLRTPPPPGDDTYQTFCGT